MTDDIVTRLRTDFECYDHAKEAADEIERLRMALQLMAVAYAQDIGLNTDEEHINEMVSICYREAMRRES